MMHGSGVMPGSRARIVAHLELTVDHGPRARFSAWAPFPIALLVALAAAAGIFDPAIYARETASWAAQGTGQDWVNLVVAVPVLLVTAGLALRGSRKARVLVGGALLYVAYAFAIYAVALHFGALFLVHCAILGLATFALADLVQDLAAAPAAGWYDDTAPLATAAGTLIAISAVFAALWLSQIVGALWRGGDPPELAATGLVANPVHVLDLALVLPLMAVTGAGLLRRAPRSLVLAPILLGFAVLMALAIAGMIVAMYLRGVALDLAPSVAMALVAAGGLAVLVALLRHVRP
jgi:hypothetical protein